MKLFLQEHNISNILNEANNLMRHLNDRRVPVEKNEISKIRREIEQKIKPPINPEFGNFD